MLILAAAAETPPSNLQIDAVIANWGVTGSAPQTGSSAHTSGKAFGAPIVVSIDKAAQEMKVFVDSVERYSWKVSTGLRAYDTPIGAYTARSMNKIWYSRQWDDAPMPHAIFFTRKGHAIHGTAEERKLGRPASHGCVRLSLANASTLFALVKETGLEKTEIVLHGELPPDEVKAARSASLKREVRAATKTAKTVLNKQKPGSKTKLTRSERKRQPVAAKQETAAKQPAKPSKKFADPKFDPYAVGTPRRLSRRERKEWLRLYYGGGYAPDPRALRRY